MRRPVLTLAFLLVAAAPAAAQGESVVVDKVLAVVGNKPLLQSQVEEDIFSRQAQGAKLPDLNSPEMQALRSQVLGDLINQELLVQEALRDTSIKVTDQEVASRVEQQIKRVRGGFTSEVDYRAELKKAGFGSPEEYRRWLTEQQRRGALQEALMTSLRDRDKLKPVAPTEEQMRAFFESRKASLGKRPATLSFKQIVFAPQADSASKASARALADSIAAALREGADFATAARRFSQDPGSAQQGGDLGWLRRGPPLAPEFEKVAFALKPGVISNPVESPFGYHIIQVKRVQPAEIDVRHILIMPQVTDADAAAARQRAESVALEVRGGAPFDSLQRVYHDQAEEREAKLVALTQLPPAYQAALAHVDSGSVAPIFTLDAPNNRSKFVVAYVLATTAEGEVSYDDVRDAIRNALSKQLAEQRYVEQLRKSAYVEIREP
ncbi:MAG TPA: peptidylprolyl isomerase [Gemmatimonadales bacterium]|nr:peptidylprolyl isomerase [Gemmatimonadales bacterium]